MVVFLQMILYDFIYNDGIISTGSSDLTEDDGVEAWWYDGVCNAFRALQCSSRLVATAPAVTSSASAAAYGLLLPPLCVF